MDITQKLFAQAIRFGEVRPSSGGIYGRNLIRAFEDRYGFVESPKTAAEFDLAKGIVFSHGYFRGRIVIDKVQIYNNGIVVETKSDTDDCVRIIEDVAAWAAKNTGAQFVETDSSPQLYLSHFEVETTIDLSGKLKVFQNIGDQLNNFMTSYNEKGREFTLSSFSLQIDPASAGPTPFKFERRAGKALSTNLYYSSAPLKTQDHIKLLKVIEKAFT